jgi:tRNA-specific 2-thiouridylase
VEKIPLRAFLDFMRILVALSGGVDSAVAASLLKEEGHDIVGVYFRSWQDERSPFGPCPWQEDRNSARAVADALKVEFRVLNLIEKYREHVVHYLVEGYRSGQTPNPDIRCNRDIKFGILWHYARSEGFDGLATGHYARIIQPKDGPPRLHEAKDPSKDQSYFLCMVRPEPLANTFFPLGNWLKSEVRKRAQHLGLPNADRKDSQGICFLGNSRTSIREFLAQYLPESPGEIVTPEGRVVGIHRGLHGYTIGQRKGLRVPSNSDFNHYVVVAKEEATHRLVVAFESKFTGAPLWNTRAQISSLNFIGERPRSGETLWGKPRYRDPSQKITYREYGENKAEIQFDRPQRALAPGQFIALYRDTQLIGGGVYEHVF